MGGRLEAAQGGATSTCKSLQSTPALAPTQERSGRLECTCMPTRGFRSIAHLFQQTSTPALHDRACTHCNCSIVWQHEPTQAPIRKRRSAMYYPSPRSCPTSARIGRMCGITTLITDSCEAHYATNEPLLLSACNPSTHYFHPMWFCSNVYCSGKVY